MKIFYGWYILAVGMVGAFLGSGLSQLFMGVMLKPLTEEFGWSRTAATGAVTTGTILAGLVSLGFGKLADRFGPRVLSSFGALTVAAVYFTMTQFAALWHFYVIFVIGRVVATNTLSSITPQTAVVNWFRRFRGRAMGLLSMSTPLGSSAMIFIAHFIMQRHGWRTVFATFAATMLLLHALPAALIFRRRPEDLGLMPDGVDSHRLTSSQAAQPPSPREPPWTLGEAVRTRALWLLIAAVVTGSGVNSGVGFHLTAFYTDAGLLPAVAVAAVGVYALTGALGNVVWGFLSERISERVLGCIVMVLTAVAILYLETVRTPAGAFVFAVLFGLTSRGESTLISIILAQYYGRRSYGTISGFVLPFNMVGLGFGPLLSSISFDLTGSYHIVLILFTAVSLLSAGVFWLAKKPQPRNASLAALP